MTGGDWFPEDALFQDVMSSIDTDSPVSTDTSNFGSLKALYR